MMDDESLLKYTSELSEIFMKKIRELEILISEPSYFVYEYYHDLKLKLDLIREKIKVRIDEYFEELLTRVEKFEKSCVDNLELDSEKNLCEMRLFLERHENISKSFEENYENLSDLSIQMESENRKLQKNIHEVQSTILKNNYFHIESDFLEGEFNHESIVRLIPYTKEEETFKLATCSDDNSIKLWNIFKRNCIQTLKGHTRSVTKLMLLNENCIVSASLDSTVRIWDLKKNKCIKKFNLDNLWVYSLVKYNDSEFFSGTDNGTILLWNLNQESFTKLLVGHTKTVTCILLGSNNMLISGASDNLIKIWNCEDGISVQTLQGHLEEIKSLFLISSNRLLSSSMDETIRVWDLLSCSCSKIITLENSVWYMSLLDSDSTKLIFISKNRFQSSDFIEIWDKQNLSCISKSKKTNIRFLNAKVLSSSKLITCSSRKVIEIWDTNSLDLYRTFVAHTKEINDILLIE